MRATATRIRRQGLIGVESSTHAATWSRQASSVSISDGVAPMRPAWTAASTSSAACSTRPIDGKIDHAGGALQGVKSPKHAVDPLVGKPLALGDHEIVARLLDQIARLGNELVVKRVHGGEPVRTATCRTRSASDTGLTR